MAAEIETVGIVGAGFMGSGVAESVARAGLATKVHEPASAPLERSRERVAGSVARAVRGGKLDEAEAKALIDAIEWTEDPGELADCDLVVEAVTEDPPSRRRSSPTSTGSSPRRRSSPRTRPRSRSPSSPPRPSVATA